MQGISGMTTKGPKALEGQPIQTSELESPGSAGGVLSKDKDLKESSTESKFGDLWKNIQAKYGAKPDKVREIKKTLGKDDFLKIMITQMKNQDPTNPFKAEEMATQMAQFASVEQLQNLNNSVGKMANGGQPLERLAMTNLIGKTVTVDRERFVHNDNETSTLGFALDRDSKVTKLKIISEAGETILEKDLGPMKAGEQTFVWDGAKTNGMPVKSGNFLFRMEATDPGERPIAMNSKSQAKVVGVAFDGPEGSLLVGDAKAPQKITMRNVIRIDVGTDAPAIPGARSMASALQEQGIGAPQTVAAVSPAPQGASNALSEKANSAVHGANYMSFGRGAAGAAAAGADPRKAMEAYEAATLAAGKNSATENNEKSAEKGFPSGFSSGDTESK